MELAYGNYKIGPENGQLLLKTSRTGLGRKAGHDLTIEVTRWSGEVMVYITDTNQSSVRVSALVDSLEVVDGTGGVKPLTVADRAQIKKIMREEILRPSEHPAVTFTSRQVTGTPQVFMVDGDLTIVGHTHPVAINVESDGNGRVWGSATVIQTRWGIKPHSAFLGALRLADEIQVNFDVNLTASLAA